MKNIYEDVRYISGQMNDETMIDIFRFLNDGFEILHLSTHPVNVGTTPNLSWIGFIAVVLVKQEEATMEWIKCSDRLPSIRQNVIAWWDKCAIVGNVRILEHILSITQWWRLNVRLYR